MILTLFEKSANVESSQKQKTPERHLPKARNWFSSPSCWWFQKTCPFLIPTAVKKPSETTHHLCHAKVSKTHINPDMLKLYRTMQNKIPSTRCPPAICRLPCPDTLEGVSKIQGRLGNADTPNEKHLRWIRMERKYDVNFKASILKVSVFGVVP